MSFWELFLISIGLSMDAFAVAICKGLSLRKIIYKDAVLVGLYFGLSQALMPLLGYIAGKSFASYIQAWSHWLVFLVLSFVGGKMIYESFKNPSCDIQDHYLNKKLLGFKNMFPLALATSIDALAVGITFSLVSIKVLPTILTIGLVTFIFSTVAVYIGNYFGCKHKAKAEISGGVILILIGLKFLLNHFNVISF